jgi:putative endonuclease
MTALSRRAGYRQGLRAETIAALFLRLKGYRILARRFTSPVGEIDLVARRGTSLVFVEVKARPTLDAAAESIRGR